ncbi:hypothetical protein D3C87_1875130 [compost metagenome]
MKALLEVCIPLPVIGGIDAQDIGKEDGVESTLLQLLDEVGPCCEIVEIGQLIFRMPPRPVVDVRRDVHGKAIEYQTLAHSFSCLLSLFPETSLCRNATCVLAHSEQFLCAK